MAPAPALVGLSAMAAAASAVNHGYNSSKRWLPRAAVPGATSADELVAEVDLPKHLDWRDANGRNLVTADWNQHIPVYCGACWIHATTSALNDRIKIMRGGRFPDVMLGRQVITNCVPAADGGPPPGCAGGDPWMIHRYMNKHKVPDESCMPYQARNMGCTPDTVCLNCYPGDKGCFAVKHWTGYGVSTYGDLSGEVAMMKEIYARGPIVCMFATDDKFMFNYSQNVEQHEGVYVTDQVFTEDQIDHVMEVAGWGETPSGLKYWVIRNSWGTYWGSAGWLKLRRGVNQMLSESQCDWAVPTFDDLDSVLEGRVLGSYAGLFRTKASEALASQLSAVPKATAEDRSAAPTLAQGAAGEGWSSAPAVALSFAAGAAVALAAARFAGRVKSLWQPPLLG
mmetsp:Transcript_16998/g.53321  ORF Transcript_16998/g.53321 Transcript_16998/m.53321 type:complete len:396 (-) Transcript_16998:277-1464(-)